VTLPAPDERGRGTKCRSDVSHAHLIRPRALGARPNYADQP
jgi:hypothetical protein